jgi:hypothetical protein
VALRIDTRMTLFDVSGHATRTFHRGGLFGYDLSQHTVMPVMRI